MPTIKSSAEFPEKFKLAADLVLASWGIHFFIINGYHAFYVISEATHRVIIVRFLFQKSNWIAILRQGFSLL